MKFSVLFVLAVQLLPLVLFPPLRRLLRDGIRQGRRGEPWVAEFLATWWILALLPLLLVYLWRAWLP